jgi:hypothetical protein
MRPINSGIQYPKIAFGIPPPNFQVYFTTESFIPFAAVYRSHPFSRRRDDGTFHT